MGSCYSTRSNQMPNQGSSAKSSPAPRRNIYSQGISATKTTPKAPGTKPGANQNGGSFGFHKPTKVRNSITEKQNGGTVTSDEVNSNAKSEFVATSVSKGCSTQNSRASSGRGRFGFKRTVTGSKDRVSDSSVTHSRESVRSAGSSTSKTGRSVAKQTEVSHSPRRAHQKTPKTKGLRMIDDTATSSADSLHSNNKTKLYNRNVRQSSVKSNSKSINRSVSLRETKDDRLNANIPKPTVVEASNDKNLKNANLQAKHSFSFRKPTEMITKSYIPNVHSTDKETQLKSASKSTLPASKTSNISRPTSRSLTFDNEDHRKQNNLNKNITSKILAKETIQGKSVNNSTLPGHEIESKHDNNSMNVKSSQKEGKSELKSANKSPSIVSHFKASERQNGDATSDIDGKDNVRPTNAGVCDNALYKRGAPLAGEESDLRGASSLASLASDDLMIDFDVDLSGYDDESVLDDGTFVEPHDVIGAGAMRMRTGSLRHRPRLRSEDIHPYPNDKKPVTSITGKSGVEVGRARKESDAASRRDSWRAKRASTAEDSGNEALGELNKLIDLQQPPVTRRLARLNAAARPASFPGVYMSGDPALTLPPVGGSGVSAMILRPPRTSSSSIDNVSGGSGGMSAGGGVVGNEDKVVLDALQYRQMAQEFTLVKTMLHRLKRLLQEDELSSPLTVTAGKENAMLREQMQLMRHQLEDQERTIKLLQQQMTKYACAGQGEGQDVTHKAVQTQQINHPVPDAVSKMAPAVPARDKSAGRKTAAAAARMPNGIPPGVAAQGGAVGGATARSAGRNATSTLDPSSRPYSSSAPLSEYHGTQDNLDHVTGEIQGSFTENMGDNRESHMTGAEEEIDVMNKLNNDTTVILGNSDSLSDILESIENSDVTNHMVSDSSVDTKSLDNEVCNNSMQHPVYENDFVATGSSHGIDERNTIETDGNANGCSSYLSENNLQRPVDHSNVKLPENVNGPLRYPVVNANSETDSRKNSPSVECSYSNPIVEASSKHVDELDKFTIDDKALPVVEISSNHVATISVQTNVENNIEKGLAHPVVKVDQSSQKPSYSHAASPKASNSIKQDSTDKPGKIKSKLPGLNKVSGLKKPSKLPSFRNPLRK